MGSRCETDRAHHQRAVLAMLETPDGLVAVEPEEIVIYAMRPRAGSEQKRVGIGQKRPLAAGSRGVIVPLPGGEGFEAFVAGNGVHRQTIYLRSRRANGRCTAARATIHGRFCCRNHASAEGHPAIHVSPSRLSITRHATTSPA